MSDLPNSHDVLSRHPDLFSDSYALIGVTDADVSGQLNTPGVLLSEQADVFQRLPTAEGWQRFYGYDSPELAQTAVRTAVVFVPKARAELDMRLGLAQSLLSEGGNLVVVGEKREGIAGASRQLKALFPSAHKIDSARHCQIWSATVPSGSERFELTQWLSWHSEAFAGETLEVAGLPGVFSQGELDEGTRLLLETYREKRLRGSRVLDFGCGAGVIGGFLTAFARAREGEPPTVDGVDVQAQAVCCARETYRRNGVQGEIIASAGLPPAGRKYHNVVSNPPFHKGVQKDTGVAEAFIRNAVPHLVTGGELRIVANRFLPYENLIREAFGSVSLLAETNRFGVWSARKR